MAPSPVPGLPAVEYPSRRASARLAMPLPRSRASISRPAIEWDENAWRRISPPLPCLSRLVAASVTTIATRRQRQRKVLDARALVLERQAQSDPVAVGQRLQACGAAAAVVDGVAGQLAGGRDDLGLVDQAEAELDRPRPHQLTDEHDVFG